jgi:hypothetical protein
MITLAPSPFELWAAREGYATAPAVASTPDRKYADRQTQAAFDAWDAGCRYVAMIVTESTLETEALCDKLKALACAK